MRVLALISLVGPGCDCTDEAVWLVGGSPRGGGVDGVGGGGAEWWGSAGHGVL